MTNKYRVFIEAMKPYTVSEELYQIDLADTFINEQMDMLVSEGKNLKDHNTKRPYAEYIYYVGTTYLKLGYTIQQFESDVRNYIWEHCESKPKSSDIKVKVGWIDLEHFQETSGDKI